MKPLPVTDLDEILVQTERLWENARGKRLFLSGATGFIGIWLLESLAHCNRRMDLGISAVALTRNPSRISAQFPHIAEESGIQFVQGDIRNFEFPDGEFDYVVHGAAPTTTASSLDPEDLLTTLIDGTKRVLSLARSAAAKKLLFISSGAVYGRQPADVTHISEDYRGGPDWINPHSAYAEGKRVAEQLCATAASSSDIQFAIARCFAFVGPHLPLDQHFAIGNFIGDAIAGRDIAIRGDGTPKRSYLYAGDLAVWLWTLMLSEGLSAQNPAVVNVGSDEAICIADLARCVADEINQNTNIRILRPPTNAGATEQYVPSIDRACHWYGLKPMTPLREAIRRTADWYRGQRLSI